MVETPAAALMAAAFVREASFLSIGTNDLTQYNAGRGPRERARRALVLVAQPRRPEAYSPGRAGHARSQGRAQSLRRNGGSPMYTPLLIGLGLRRLSMAPKDIPAVKRVGARDYH